MKRVRGVYGRLQGLGQGRSVYLLVSLLVLVSIGPWFTEHLVGRGLWELLFTLVTLSSIHMLGIKRGQALTNQAGWSVTHRRRGPGRRDGISPVGRAEASDRDLAAVSNRRG